MPGLRFYLDENVDARIAEGLRRRGLIVSTAGEAGMLGAADEAQLEHAARTESVFVTGDHDFVPLAAEWVRSGRHHPGVIVIGHRRALVGHAVELLALCDQVFDPPDLRDRLEFL